MSLYKKHDICCFYLVYRLGKVIHSASDYVKQDMGTPLSQEGESYSTIFFEDISIPQGITASLNLYFNSIFLVQSHPYTS